MDNNYIQVAQNEMNTVSTVSTSRDWQDNIGEGLMVTVVGIGVVFFVLCIMILFINLVKKLEVFLDNKIASGKNNEVAVTEASSSPSISSSGDIDDETMAVIIASVAAVVHNSRVRSVSVIPTAVRSGGAWVSQVRTALQNHRVK